jgi:iron(III) transport system permease protein
MTEARRRPLDLWQIVSIMIMLIYVVFLIVPLFSILKESVVSSDGEISLQYFVKFFSETYYLRTILNSFKLSLAATAFALLIGTPLAYLNSFFEIRGRSVMQILIVISSMSAPFVGAYAWILLLGRSGLITKFMWDVFKIDMPNIYGFSGVVLVLTLQLYPLVFMYVSGALKNIDNSLIEASQNLGVGTFKRFFQIILPLSMTSILASALLVFMRALADFGTPLLIGEGYRTFPVEIYKQYVGESSQNHSFAAAISVIAILITTIVFAVQKVAANRFSFKMNALNSIERKKAKGLLNVVIHLYSYLVVLIGIMPQVYLIYCSFRKTNAFGNFVDGYSLDSYKRAWSFVRTALPNTLMIGGIAIATVVLLSILIAYLVVRRPNALNNMIDTSSMLPYIIPGSVVGIALVITFSDGPMVLTGTITIMIIAMCIRRIPYTIRSSVAILQQIPVTTEEASISLGASKLKTFFKVTTPMMASGIVSGAILSWVTILTELSASIMLYSAKSQTLTLSIYVFISRGTDGAACAVATILTAFTVLSLAIFMKVSGKRDIIL